MKWSIRVKEVVTKIQARLPKGAKPKIGVVLGSGLGDYGNRLEGALRIPYAEVGLPASTVLGHAGNLIYGRKVIEENKTQTSIEILLMQGRVHYYEGYDMETVVLPVRTLIAAGCQYIILTSAVGAICTDFHPGQMVVIRDHINFMGCSPLRGENDSDLGPRFPDMTTVYDENLQKMVENIGRSLGIPIGNGVYAAVAGPQYETPAEIRMLQAMGADLVGMSMVPEAIAARHMGIPVIAFSCVTNMAAGLTGAPLSHHEVAETANSAKEKFTQLLDGVLAALV